MCDMGKVGIVTVTYNSEQVIEAFMDSINGQTYRDFILYVIDNASKDDTLLRFEKNKSLNNFVLLRNSENIGVAAGNNQGIEAAISAGCKYVLLINNDTEFEPTLITKLLMGLDEYDCKLIVPKILFHNEPTRIWSAGGSFLPFQAYKNIHIGEGELDSAKFNEAICITYAPTCCMMIESSVFESVGLMDERYFVYFDDTDFCLRVLRAGFKMSYLPTARLTHKVSSLTGGGCSEFTMRYMIRNRVYFLRKNFGRVYLGFALGYIQLSLFIRLFCFHDKWKNFFWKEKAFFEGLKIN